MNIVSVLLNVLWLIGGGLLCGILWCIAGAFSALTIVGLPWSGACFRLARFTFFPFGQEMVPVALVKGAENEAAGCLRAIGNVAWFIFPGWILFIAHLVHAFLCAITIIGIPFAWAHVKLAAASLFPLGRRVVTADHADLLRFARRP